MNRPMTTEELFNKVYDILKRKAESQIFLNMVMQQAVLFLL